ncbi:MAG: MarR family transcriptional regulator [Candidatus Krumholzibacteriia bacterium]
MPLNETQQAFIQDFGEGYQVFGLSRLMGQIVGLLLCEEGASSLTEITEQLSVSKGPVSQITRRLADHRLLARAPVAGSRRDHYEAVPDIFGQAYANHADKQAKNLELAHKYQALLAAEGDAAPAYFRRRVEEMTCFYELMLEYQEAFKLEWERRRRCLAAGVPVDECEDAS